jgi:Ser/Thr protein kinase RdoA (MazF antagonist)
MPTLGHEILGTDLEALVATVGVRLVAAAPITGLPSATLGRATFRLEFGDGRVLKGRRFDTPADAERVELLTRALGLPSLPRVWARRGAALLEDWIPGVSLDGAAPSLARFREAGALLGAIHGVTTRLATPALLPAAVEAPPSVDARRASTVRGVDGLARLRLVTAAAARRLRALVDAHAPSDPAAVRPQRGIVHRDFCAENIVLARDGQLWVVDNGTLTIDAYDLDLGRTWYRWPMTPEQWNVFVHGYRLHRSPDGFIAHFPFWAIAVLVEAALFRHQAVVPGAWEPIRRLEALLDAVDRGDARNWPIA